MTVNRLFPALVLLVATIACTSPTEPSVPDGAIRINGTVQYLNLEGGFWAIRGDDGVTYDPLNGLAAAFQRENTRVTLSRRSETTSAAFIWSARSSKCCPLKFASASLICGLGTAMLVSIFAPAGALAQDQPPPQPTETEERAEPEFEDEVTVIATTRTGRRVEDEPIRVEVVPQEEIDEKVFMTPGDVSMMLTETNGLRVQVTSPSLGAASVRVQGLRGRYTQVLADGLPLYGPAGTIGILQIPPMDLAQVEVIKGVASALQEAPRLAA